MPPTQALSRLQTEGHGGTRVRVNVADATPWDLQYNRIDCISDNNSDDNSDDDSMTFSSINNPTKERKALPSFKRGTVWVATEVDFFCSTCNLSKTVAALRSHKNIIESSTERNFLKTEEGIDYYELNWRLIMTTELLGESQAGGAIIGLMLELTTDTFRNKRTEMKLQLGVEQVRIGKRTVAPGTLKKKPWER
jgi:hypothetical protein